MSSTPRAVQHPPRRLRLLPPVVAAAAALVMTGLTAPTSTASAAAPPNPPAHHAAVHRPTTVTPQTLGLKPVSIPGMAATSSTVQLVTGQRVHINPAAGGKYTVNQVGHVATPTAQTGRRPLPPGQLVIQGKTEPGASKPTITAEPAYAQQLIADGKVDPHLFDLTYLTAHADGTGTVPVVVHYTKATTPSAVQQAAEVLPGSNYVEGSATADQATVDVQLAASGTFWSGVTHTPIADPKTKTGKVWYDNPNAPQVLDPGISALTLAGAPQAPRPAHTVANYQLTVEIHGFTDRAHWLSRDWVIGWAYGFLLGVTGPGAGQQIRPIGIACNQTSNCDTLIATFAAPAGVYMFDSQQVVWNHGRFAMLLNYRPQITLDADISLDLSADNSSWTSLRTPQASEAAVYAANATRTLPDGTRLTDAIGLGAINRWYDVGAYVMPAPKATVGSFHLELNEINEQPLVAMTVTKPSGSLTLTPQYQFDDGTINQLGSQAVASGGWAYPMHRFPAGTHRYPIVEAGYGSTADFAGHNLTGKLALIRLDPTKRPYPCAANLAPLENAIAAGAAGVVFDPTNPQIDNTSGCPVPLEPVWSHYLNSTVPNIPWITIQSSQAQELEKLLRTEAVTVSMTSTNAPAYLYVNSVMFQGGIPASVAQTLTAKTVSTRVSTIHASGPAAPELDVMGAWEQDNFGFMPAWGVWRTDGAPYKVTEYLGQPSPDSYLLHNWSDCGFCIGDYSSVFHQSHPVPKDTRSYSSDYNEPPFSLGPRENVERLHDLSPSWDLNLCEYCRQGDTLWPIISENSGANPQADWFTFWLSNAQLSYDGVTIPLSEFRYTLPAKSTNYTLATNSSSADVTWKFTSSAPTADDHPAYTTCIATLVFHSTEPCTAVPLVFLRFDGHLNPANQAPAGVRETVSVTAYHQDPNAPAISSLALQTSFDGGVTWSTAKVEPTRTAGTYNATFRVPELAETNGYVTLRTIATDAGGNSVNETLYNSYALH